MPLSNTPRPRPALLASLIWVFVTVAAFAFIRVLGSNSMGHLMQKLLGR